MSDAPVQIGPYRVQRELGRGGMGVVYEATGQDGKAVAVKVLLPGTDERRQRRFLREGRAQTKLVHPNVVAVLDVGEDSDCPYLVQELVRGQSLEDRIQTAGPLEPDQARKIGASLADALAAAHAAGILHRDIKPDNVLLDSSGRPYLTDFGLAKDLERVGHTEELTRSGTFLGTPSFWAPEQARGEAVGSAADVYGLGATLHAALTGEPLFVADTLLGLIHEIQERSPPALNGLRADVSPQLEALILRCLAKTAEERPSAKDLRDALGALGPSSSSFRGLIAVVAVALATIALGAALLVRAATNDSQPVVDPSVAAVPSVAPVQSASEDSIAADLYEIGLQAALAGNDAEAAHYARQAAESGHTKAMYEFGAMLSEGRGTPRNLDAAIGWYRKARAQGHTGAMIDLGLLHLQGEGLPRNEELGVELFREAADGGDPQGMFNLGVCLADGTGLPKNETEAVAWFRRGAALGHTDCMNNLGRALNGGLGVEADSVAALGWYRKAAEKGDPTAMVNLGLILMQGEGVPRDFEEAGTWLERAKAEGSKEERASAVQALLRLQLLRLAGGR